MTARKTPTLAEQAPDLETVTGLLDAWSQRDTRYRQRRFGISEREVAAVRAWRRQEILDLPFDEDHPRMFRQLEQWEAPTPLPSAGRR